MIHPFLTKMRRVRDCHLRFSGVKSVCLPEKCVRCEFLTGLFQLPAILRFQNGRGTFFIKPFAGGGIFTYRPQVEPDCEDCEADHLNRWEVDCGDHVVPNGYSATARRRDAT